MVEGLAQRVSAAAPTVWGARLHLTALPQAARIHNPRWSRLVQLLVAVRRGAARDLGRGFAGPTRDACYECCTIGTYTPRIHVP